MNIDKKMEDEFNQRLYERLDMIYWDICNGDNRIKFESEVYKKYDKVCDNIKKSNPKVRYLLEDQCYTELTKEDSKDIVDYFQNDYYRRIEEDKHIMIEVAKETYLLLKSFGMIKELDDKK